MYHTYHIIAIVDLKLLKRQNSLEVTSSPVQYYAKTRTIA